MEHFRDYRAPDANDYKNVLALNVAFLEATSTLKGPQRGRLAMAPFLLFSLRENELNWWERALADQVQEDFLSPTPNPTPRQNHDLRQIQNSAVSFLSGVARRRPYVARIVSGATMAWCEKVRDVPLLTLLDRVATRDDLLVSRIDPSTASGSRLLTNGTSSNRELRRYSHLCVLQSLLTSSHSFERLPLAAAARDLTGPVRSSAKKV